MALQHSPRIVTDGLVLCLDAANPKSYIGSGVTWGDLSGTVSGTTQGTLTNGPIFSSENSGCIVFDGSNDYCSFYASDLTTTATIEMWVKVNNGWTGGNGKMFLGWNRYDVWTGTSSYAGSIGFNTASSDLYGIDNTTVASLNLTNKWSQYIFVMRTDVSYTNNKIYINAVPFSLSQRAGSESAANRNFNNGQGRIAIWGNDLNYCMPMNCAVFKVYNKELSAAEVLQNFNSLRGRFGL